MSSRWATRSDREVMAWVYGGGEGLYFLAREGTYFWALNVSLLGIQVAALRGR